MYLYSTALIKSRLQLAIEQRWTKGTFIAFKNFSFPFMLKNYKYT